MTMTQNAPSSPRVVAESRLIAGPEPDVRLHLLNKRRHDLHRFSAERTLVMMHGATFSSASLFDVAVADMSFMDVLAQAGYDVWAVDARGYGGSSRPPEMSRAPEDGSPLVTARTALDDFSTAVDFICRSRGVVSVNVLGMSWGATIAGAFASAAGARLEKRLEKLILVTPLWLSKERLRIDAGGPLGAYRIVSPRAFEAVWRGAAPEHARHDLIPDGWFETWEKATLATDPDSPHPRTIRAPSGAVQDVRVHWTADDPFYDPGTIACPVLVLAAEWDVDVRFDVAQDLFVRLERASYKRLVVIGQGTHMILMERNRRQAFDAVIGFLEERVAAAN
ncbi:alpha/beta hydrolase [Bradyrhizobium sp. SSBR45G]|uniref:alpha/beta hydrolase n=1 Tax=unclassified Bradyrhizobium TaxID=2631580 RepID=UPI0023429489|nr:MULTISPECIES: alpha/beta fold hydrolase [unclassified Bradyrhizobium]GLH75933.1 alpha/beta hydrolase [Bradyrhizobium sp. SSBR45G]GLH85170.1 alpha/beta hydrolase [Bradyrhizobium sp. SSBR45R]